MSSIFTLNGVESADDDLRPMALINIILVNATGIWMEASISLDLHPWLYKFRLQPTAGFLENITISSLGGYTRDILRLLKKIDLEPIVGDYDSLSRQKFCIP